MIVITTVAELRQELRGKTDLVGFVPTMGALHAGHAQLLATARKENELLVASIFVNPLQFDRADDLNRYPRSLELDLAICADSKVDIVFAPEANELYPQEQLTFVDVPILSENLCGAFRPGHFRGVCTVVLKLFNIVAPKRAYFGQKDAQQLAVIRRMALDLNSPVSVVGVATVREADGLAMSSRNRHLSKEERTLAPRLYQGLQKAAGALDRGERSSERLRSLAQQTLAGIKIEYLDLVDPDSLQPLAEVAEKALVAGAIWLGSTRLIDNVLWPSATT